MKKLSVGLIAITLMLGTTLAAASADPGPNLNDPAYWETYFPHDNHCVQYEAGATTPHGTITNDGTAVTLNPIQPQWGNHWEGLVVKGSDDRTIVHHPEPGVPYFAPANSSGAPAEVSNWIVCKASGPPPPTTTTSTTVPPTTLPPTTVPPTTVPPTTVPPTTVPPTTVPPTTVPPSTTLPPTTTIPPTTTTSTTTTSVPPTTQPPTTTEPPSLNIDVEATCDNRDGTTGIVEPVRSFWSGNYEVGAAEPRVAFYIEDAAGTPIGSIEPSTLATPGWHDNWFEYIEEPIDFTYTVYVFIDGEQTRDADGNLLEYTAVCGGETTTTVVIDTTTTTLPDDSCDEDSPSWNDETQSCDLPFTGVEVEHFALGGLLLLLIGAILVWAGKTPEDV